MYDILISETASVSIKNLERSSQERIISVLERMRINPLKKLKKVIGDNAYNLSIDYYKIFFDVNGHELRVLTVKERKNEK